MTCHIESLSSWAPPSWTCLARELFIWVHREVFDTQHLIPFLGNTYIYKATAVRSCMQLWYSVTMPCAGKSEGITLCSESTDCCRSCKPESIWTTPHYSSVLHRRHNEKHQPWDCEYICLTQHLETRGGGMHMTLLVANNSESSEDRDKSA